LAPEYAKSQSWDILFDPKYKGRVSVLEGADDGVPFVAHMIRVDAYSMDEADWRKVQAKLRAGAAAALRLGGQYRPGPGPGLGRDRGRDELAHHLRLAEPRT
jgi:hypothetical protein